MVPTRVGARHDPYENLVGVVPCADPTCPSIPLLTLLANYAVLALAVAMAQGCFLHIYHTNSQEMCRRGQGFPRPYSRFATLAVARLHTQRNIFMYPVLHQLHSSALS